MKNNQPPPSNLIFKLIWSLVAIFLSDFLETGHNGPPN